MSLYHCHIKNCCRHGWGGNAIDHLAYITAEKQHDDEKGIDCMQEKNRGIVSAVETFLPEHAPKKYRDENLLWNDVQRAEKNKNARLYREFEIALPLELDPEQRIQLAKSFAFALSKQGMCATVAVHEKEGNPHAHIMCTTRPFDERGKWANKKRKEYYDKDKNKCSYAESKKSWGGEPKYKTVQLNDWNKKEKVKEWRKTWEIMHNEKMHELGFDKTYDIDCRSYKEQGIDKIPGIHISPVAERIDKRYKEGKSATKSYKVEKQKSIKKINKQYELAKQYKIKKYMLANELKNIDKEIKEYDKEIDKLANEIEKLNKQFDDEKEIEQKKHNDFAKQLAEMKKQLAEATQKQAEAKSKRRQAEYRDEELDEEIATSKQKNITTKSYSKQQQMQSFTWDNNYRTDGNSQLVRARGFTGDVAHQSNTYTTDMLNNIAKLKAQKRAEQQQQAEAEKQKQIENERKGDEVFKLKEAEAKNDKLKIIELEQEKKYENADINLMNEIEKQEYLAYLDSKNLKHKH